MFLWLTLAFRRYFANRQPGKALTYFLRLRRPNVFDLIRDNNLFTDVQDQALLLVEFDHELMEKRQQEGRPAAKSEAIALLVDHIHSIPVRALLILFLASHPNPNCVFRSGGWCSSCRAGRTSSFCIWMP